MQNKFLKINKIINLLKAKNYCIKNVSIFKSMLEKRISSLLPWLWSFPWMFSLLSQGVGSNAFHYDQSEYNTEVQAWRTLEVFDDVMASLYTSKDFSHDCLDNLNLPRSIHEVAWLSGIHGWQSFLVSSTFPVSTETIHHPVHTLHSFVSPSDFILNSHVL